MRIGRYGERHFLHRFGHYLHLDERDLRLGRYLFQRFGRRVVFLARFTAFLRSLAGLLAGANAMPLKPFLIASGLGALAWFVLVRSSQVCYSCAEIERGSKSKPIALPVLLEFRGAAVTPSRTRRCRRDITAPVGAEHPRARWPAFQASKATQRGGMGVTVSPDGTTLEHFDPFRRRMTFRAWGADRERAGLFFELVLTLAHQTTATNAKHRRRGAHDFDCIDGHASATAEPLCC